MKSNSYKLQGLKKKNPEEQDMIRWGKLESPCWVFNEFDDKVQQMHTYIQYIYNEMN